MADLGTSLASILQVPGLQELLNQAVTEQRQVAPLRTGIMQQAANMLPNSAFGGAAGRPTMSSIAPANYSTPAPSGGISSATAIAAIAAALGGTGALAKALGTPGSSNIARLVNMLKGSGTSPYGPFANGDNPGNALDPNPPNALDPNYVPPGTQPTGSNFDFGVGGGNPSGPNLDAFSFFNPSVIQNPANPNAAAFGGAPIAGPNQQTAARRTFGGPLGNAY